MKYSEKKEPDINCTYYFILWGGRFMCLNNNVAISKLNYLHINV